MGGGGVDGDEGGGGAALGRDGAGLVLRSGDVAEKPWRWSAWWENTLAIGGNPEAARLAGVNVVSMRIWIFALQGLICAVAGIMLASRITSGQPNAATGLELSVISACVLGGVSLAGGRAAMTGVIVGVMIMGIAENVMNLLNIQAFYQYVVRGLILLIAVLLDNLRSTASR